MKILIWTRKSWSYETDDTVFDKCSGRSELVSFYALTMAINKSWFALGKNLVSVCSGRVRNPNFRPQTYSHHDDNNWVTLTWHKRNSTNVMNVRDRTCRTDGLTAGVKSALVPQRRLWYIFGMLTSFVNISVYDDSCSWKIFRVLSGTSEFRDYATNILRFLDWSAFGVWLAYGLHCYQTQTFDLASFVFFLVTWDLEPDPGDSRW